QNAVVTNVCRFGMLLAAAMARQAFSACSHCRHMHGESLFLYAVPRVFYGNAG
nr:hypothetical protein [Tanacetum cinerariifolium]